MNIPVMPSHTAIMMYNMGIVSLILFCGIILLTFKIRAFGHRTCQYHPFQHHAVLPSVIHVTYLVVILFMLPCSKVLVSGWKVQHIVPVLELHQGTSAGWDLGIFETMSNWVCSTFQHLNLKGLFNMGPGIKIQPFNQNSDYEFELSHL